MTPASILEWLPDPRSRTAALSLAFLATVVNATSLLPVLASLSPLQVADVLAIMLLEAAIACLLIVTTLQAAERRKLAIGAWRSAVPLVAGLLPAIVVAIPYYTGWPWATPGLKYRYVGSPTALLLYFTWMNVTLAIAAQAWLSRHREEHSARAMLKLLLAGQEERRRRVVQARLQSIQARIDPAFFFRIMETIRSEYGRHIDAGEALLDELTAFLRACLPSLQPVDSTLARECELAANFMHLRNAGRERGLTLTVSVAPELLPTPFPPGVLLHAVASLAEGAHGSISLDAVASGRPRATSASVGDDAAAELIVGLQSQSALPERAVETIASRLSELLGETTPVVVAATERRGRIELRLPLGPSHA